MTEQVKLRITNLTKIFGPTPRQRPLKMLQEGKDKDEILARTGHVVGVKNVSFTVNEGEIFVVMGLSGSGKSTLIRCLNRLIEPTSGTVLLGDEDLTKATSERLREIRRTRMAMVFQHFGLFPHRTVAFNAGYGLRVRGVSEEEWRVKAVEALDLVGLKEWADHYPSSLSGGMQQRVGLARALADEQVDVLLMDEAFSALDPLIRRQMQDELLSLQERLKKTIIFITHDLNEALRVGNHVAVMRDGEVVQIGTPTEIVTEPATEYVAKFMADVDQARVLSAEFVMKPARAITKELSITQALKRIDELDRGGVYMVNGKGEPEGYIRKSRLLMAQEKGATKLSDSVSSDFPTAARFATLNELYGKYEDGVPVAIINDNGRLLGVVHPLDLLSALAVTEEVAVD